MITTDDIKPSYWRGDLFWQIAALAGPLMLQNLSQTLLGVIDTYFVSRIGTDALAAVGLGGVLYFAVMMLFRSVANSAVVFVGRAFGEQAYAKIGDDIWRCLNMVGWLSLGVVLLPAFFGWLMHFVVPAEAPQVRLLSTAYLQIRVLEIPLVMFSAVVWGFMVGRGDSRTPMALAWITVLLNMLLDWMLVLGNWGAPALGVAGAAYATVMSNGVNALLSAYILWRRPSRLAFGTGRARLASWAELRGVLRIGLPMGIGDFLEIASFSAFFALMARLGTGVAAANQIALQYMSISFTLGVGINMATSSLVAQYLGAKQPDEAEKVGYRACLLAMICMGLIGLGYLVAPEALMGIFSDEPRVVDAGVTILTLMAFYQIFDAVGIVLAGALNGAGDTTFTMLVRSILSWGMFIPLVWVLINYANVDVLGAWMGALAYLGSITIIYFFRFRSGRWKTIELT